MVHGRLYQVNDSRITNTHITNWDTAYGWGDHSTEGYLTSETSHADVLVDGDFTTAGFMKTDGSGVYSVDSNTYATETYVNTAIGDINTILDNINGEVL